MKKKEYKTIGIRFLLVLFHINTSIIKAVQLTSYQVATAKRSFLDDASQMFQVTPLKKSMHLRHQSMKQVTAY